MSWHSCDWRVLEGEHPARARTQGPTHAGATTLPPCQSTLSLRPPAACRIRQPCEYSKGKATWRLSSAMLTYASQQQGKEPEPVRRTYRTDSHALCVPRASKSRQSRTHPPRSATHPDRRVVGPGSAARRSGRTRAGGGRAAGPLPMVPCHRLARQLLRTRRARQAWAPDPACTACRCACKAR